MVDVPLYHEKQESALCGVHCVNSLLQGPFFNEWDLAKIAQELDELERNIMASHGVNTLEFLKYAAEESGNVARDGMFSIQVLQKALSNWNVATCPLTHPRMASIASDPTKADGFICHLQDHWFTIRPVDGQWWNFNSLLPAPQFVGLIYLESFLTTLKIQNWTIYVVQGRLPARADESMVHDSPMGRLWSPDQAKAANVDSSDAKTRARGRAIVDDLLDAAHRSGGSISLPSSREPLTGAGGMQSPTEDEQLQIALAHSRVAGGDAGGGVSQGLTDEQQLEMAIQESLRGHAGGFGGVSTRSGRSADGDAPLIANNSSDDPALLAAIAASLQEAPGSKPSPTAPPAPASSQPLPATRAAGERKGLANGEQEGVRQMQGMSGPCEVCVKLPNNQRLIAQFGLQSTVGDVLAWLDEKGWARQSHRLCTSFPCVPLMEPSAALGDCGLKGPREVLLLETFA